MSGLILILNTVIIGGLWFGVMDPQRFELVFGLPFGTAFQYAVPSLIVLFSILFFLPWRKTVVPEGPLTRKTRKPLKTLIFGAPGAGKSSLTLALRDELAADGVVVLDWDFLMDPAADLRAGIRVESDPTSWEFYEAMITRIMHVCAPVHVVLLGPCTPDELRTRMSFDRVFLLDVDDSERNVRLIKRGLSRVATNEAIQDGQKYRTLLEGKGMDPIQRLSSTFHTPEELAKHVADSIRTEL